MARYDEGRNNVNPDWLVCGIPFWTPVTIRIELDWIVRRLAETPDDDYRWGYHDGLCDLLAERDPDSCPRWETTA